MSNLITVQKTTTTLKLIIKNELYPENPRNYDGNLGYLINQASKINGIISIDKDNYDNDRTPDLKVYAIDYYKHPSDYSICRLDKDITEEYNEYYRSKEDGEEESEELEYDFIYVITKHTLSKSIKTLPDDETCCKYIKEELDIFQKWANGEVLQYTLYDNNGEYQDSCGGFYKIEDIRDHLPNEFNGATLSDYLVIK